MRNGSALAMQPAQADQPGSMSSVSDSGDQVDTDDLLGQDEYAKGSSSVATIIGALIGAGMVLATVTIFAVALVPGVARKWPVARATGQTRTTTTTTLVGESACH